MRSFKQQYKIVILGEGKLFLVFLMSFQGRVGKTSLILRYTDGKYNPDEISTSNAAYVERKV